MKNGVNLDVLAFFCVFVFCCWLLMLVLGGGFSIISIIIFSAVSLGY